MNADRAEDHLEYEQWAIGVLDQFHDFTEARGPLTAVPLQKKSGAERTHKALPDSVTAKLPLTERFKRTWERSVMDEAVDERGGHDVVAEHVAPLLEAFVRGENSRGVLVAAIDELEEELSLIHISEPRDQRGSRMPSSA